jgi:hypothetical protein
MRLSLCDVDLLYMSAVQDIVIILTGSRELPDIYEEYIMNCEESTLFSEQRRYSTRNTLLFVGVEM